MWLKRRSWYKIMAQMRRRYRRGHLRSQLHRIFCVALCLEWALRYSLTWCNNGLLLGPNTRNSILFLLTTINPSDVCFATHTPPAPEETNGLAMVVRCARSVFVIIYLSGLGRNESAAWQRCNSSSCQKRCINVQIQFNGQLIYQSTVVCRELG